MAKLKPCPFCGSDAIIFHEDYTMMHRAMRGGMIYPKRLVCGGCGATIERCSDGSSTLGESYDTLVQAWNRRADDGN